VRGVPFGARVTNGLQPTCFHSCLVLGSLHEFTVAFSVSCHIQVYIAELVLIFDGTHGQALRVCSRFSLTAKLSQ
jgi:hypothetical protein